MSLSQYQCLQNRSDEDKTSENKHFEQMETIVSGKGPELIKKLEFEPGTLSIFQGKYIKGLIIYNRYFGLRIMKKNSGFL